MTERARLFYVLAISCGLTIVAMLVVTAQISNVNTTMSRPTVVSSYVAYSKYCENTINIKILVQMK